jgi:hypothetical protein
VALVAASGADKQRADSKATPQDLVLKVLGAIGTGIGILGFVALFGGAILWLRADQASLPANDAVSAIPNSVLVTTGASFLIPAVLIALLAVAAIFAVYLGFNVPHLRAVRASASEAETLFEAADQMKKEADGQIDEAREALEMANTARVNALDAAEKGMSSVHAFDDAARTQADEAETKKKRALDAVRSAAEKRAEAEKADRLAKGRLVRWPVQLWTEITVGFLAILFLPPLLNEAIFSVSFFWSGVILIGVALIAALASAVVYLMTEKFIWFGVVVFVTVGIYLGFATYYSTTRNPKVEPAAALRGERAPVVGSFIADTASNLYLGTFPEGTRKPRLIVIPRAQVTSLAIGPLTDPEDAPASAVKLALAECRQSIDVPKTKEEAAHLESACTAHQRSILESQEAP